MKTALQFLLCATTLATPLAADAQILNDVPDIQQRIQKDLPDVWQRIQSDLPDLYQAPETNPIHGPTTSTYGENSLDYIPGRADN
jgi:hypothetical protein